MRNKAADQQREKAERKLPVMHEHEIAAESGGIEIRQDPADIHTRIVDDAGIRVRKRLERRAEEQRHSVGLQRCPYGVEMSLPAPAYVIHARRGNAVSCREQAHDISAERHAGIRPRGRR
jgi:hypothetical protein